MDTKSANARPIADGAAVGVPSIGLAYVVLPGDEVFLAVPRELRIVCRGVGEGYVACAVRGDLNIVTEFL